MKPSTRPAWGIAVVMAALTAAMTWPLAAGLATDVPGDYGDPLMVMWAMGWVSKTLTTALARPSALASIWDANIFYPEPHTLAFSEHFVGQSLLVLPVYWLTDNLILVYNAAFLSTFVLTGLGMFLLARALAEDDRAAPAPEERLEERRQRIGAGVAGLTAALVAAFNPYRLVYEVAHLQVLSVQWLPFALYGLHRYLVTDSRLSLALAALALAALNVSSIYYAAYCAPFVVAFALFETVRLRRWREPRVWLELWAAAAAVAVCLVPFVRAYMAVQQRLGIVRNLQEITGYSATIDHYRLVLPVLSIPLALAAIGVLAPLLRRAWPSARAAKSNRALLAIALLILLLLAVWLSLGPVVQSGGKVLAWPGLYGLFHDHVPGFNALRAPSRFAMLFFVFLALLAGLGARAIASWTRLAIPIVVLALAGYLWQTRPPAFGLNQPLPSAGLAVPPAYLTPSPVLPSIYREVEALSGDAVLLELPFGDPWYELRYMFFAARHGRRLINGYSGIFPPSYLARQRVLAKPLLDPERAAHALAGATHVIVHRGAWMDGSGTAIASWLEALGAHLLTGAGDALLYEIRSSERLAE